MTFIRIPSLTGKLYVPEPCDRERPKRPCPDCFGCQQCSDARCSVCRGQCPTASAGRPRRCGAPLPGTRRRPHEP